MIEDLKPESWTLSSNTALKLAIVNDHKSIQFGPVFTYPIYGESEQIFGYQDLNIILAFDSITFKPFVNVKYSKKLNDDIEDIQGQLLNFLPKDDVILSDETKWIDTFKKEQESFTLPDDGSKIFDYQISEEIFCVYKTNLSSEFIKKFHRRLQTILLFFIESVSFIDENDDLWDVFLTFNKSTKECVGYATTYKYWRYMGAESFDSDSDVKKRAKISQFIIFPPYQGKGHGSHLYNSIINLWISDPEITEITIEDPNESFDDLRDKNDLQRLYDNNFFDSIPDEFPINKQWLAKSQSELKLEHRQFFRLIEMILLKQNSSKFGLQVKSRILEKNYEVLTEMDENNRKDKLQTTFLSLKKEYERILGKLRSNKRSIDYPISTLGKKKKV